MRLSDDAILDTISEHTGSEAVRKGHWLRNIRYNEREYGFKKTLKDLPLLPDKKGLVLGAGPAFKRFGTDSLRRLMARPDISVIACDGALPTLANLGNQPDFVTSVDAHPVVANFYRRTIPMLRISTAKFLLCTTIHRDVIEAIKESGHLDDIYWWQPFWPENMEKAFSRKGLTQVNSGGNVGTTSYVVACNLRFRKIGLMGLEFSWSDETPLVDTQYFAQIMKIVGEDPKKAKELFKVVKNPRDGKNYVADPVYYAYLLMFREMWETAPPEIKEKTYNLTREGILSAPGLKTISAEEFARL